MIELSSEQQECCDRVYKWIRDPDDKQVFRVEGWAGTGKSTVVMQAMSAFDGHLLFAAFTGKAALVMQQKGCPEASTIHRLIYTPSGGSNKSTLDAKKVDLSKLVTQLKDQYSGDMQSIDQHPEVVVLRKDIKTLESASDTPRFRLNLDSPLRSADGLVIDEVSMVDAPIAKDLLSFNVKTLVLGDPGQLPPVAGEGFFMKGDPDVRLTQIHRQAKDSPILVLATQARLGQRLQEGMYGNCSVVRAITPAMALEADQILCGRNKTRHLNNARMRQLKGFGGDMPMPGEKLVCLRNNHEKGLLNGSLWTVVQCRKFTKTKLSLTVIPEEGGLPITVLAHNAYFTQYGHTDDPQWLEKLQAEEKGIGFEIREAESFTFGYVLTVHKSQGSQWDKVLLIDESGAFGPDAPKHLYTGITRAARQIDIKLQS